MFLTFGDFGDILERLGDSGRLIEALLFANSRNVSSVKDLQRVDLVMEHWMTVRKRDKEKVYFFRLSINNTFK